MIVATVAMIVTIFVLAARTAITDCRRGLANSSRNSARTESIRACSPATPVSKRSTVLASNKGVEEWGSVLGDKVMAAALAETRELIDTEAASTLFELAVV